MQSGEMLQCFHVAPCDSPSLLQLPRKQWVERGVLECLGPLLGANSRRWGLFLFLVLFAYLYLSIQNLKCPSQQMRGGATLAVGLSAGLAASSEVLGCVKFSQWKKSAFCTFVLNINHVSDHHSSEFYILSQNKKATSYCLNRSK